MSALKSAATVIERVSIPKPAYFAPPQALVHPSKREVVVAKSLKDMSADELAALGIEPGKLLLPVFGGKKVREQKEKKEKPKKEKSAKQPEEKKEIVSSDPFMGVKFTEAHILSDEDFIRFTRKHNIHDKGMKAIFFANGGKAYTGYETLQTAFEAMRRNVLAKLAGLTAGEPYKRVREIEGEHHVFNAGTYAEAQLIRERARELARIRESNAKWMLKPIRKAG